MIRFPRGRFRLRSQFCLGRPRPDGYFAASALVRVTREEEHMKHHRWTILPFLTAFVILASLPVKAEVLDKTKNIGGTTVHYKVVLPKDYEASKTYPGVLA